MSDQPRVSKAYLKARIRKSGHRKGRSPSKYNYHPSRKGEFPHKDTGHLRRNINLESDLREDAKNSKVRVGTNVPYAKVLELQKGRLLFRETLRREEGALRRIIEKGEVG